MIKILHLQIELNLVCGVTKTISQIVNNSDPDFQYHLFTFGGDAVEKFKSGGINTIVSVRRRKGLYQAFNVLFRIVYLVRKYNIDIIHSHHRYFDFIAFFVSKLIPVKIITSVQSKVYGKKIFSYNADQLIACSNSIKEHLINYFNIDSNKIEVIHNFIDPRDVRKLTEESILKKELRIEENTIVIGFIGRFSIKEKGVDILLEAFKKISHDYLNLKLLFVGEGDDKNYINNFVINNNLMAVTLAPTADIYKYYDIMDIVVLPSRVDPFPLVMLEAGIMKKPFIGSNVDGIAEIIENNKNGLLVEPGDVAGLANAIEWLLKNESAAKELGENLHNKVISEFTAEKVIPQYKALYEEVMNERL